MFEAEKLVIEAVRPLLENATRHDNFVAVTFSDYAALCWAYEQLTGQSVDGTTGDFASELRLEQEEEEQ